MINKMHWFTKLDFGDVIIWSLLVSLSGVNRCLFVSPRNSVILHGRGGKEDGGKGGKEVVEAAVVVIVVIVAMITLAVMMKVKVVMMMKLMMMMILGLKW